MRETEDLPYRPCAGIMLANRAGLVFVGQRIDNPGDAWQMPQGGIDPGEDPEVAAFRELGEETGLLPDHVDLLARSREEYFYDLPPELQGNIWGGRWRGQRQWWFLMRFKGEDADINIETHIPEFSRWKWAEAQDLPKLIVPFKRRIYEGVVTEFGPLI
ncbi:MAG: RNA pyrophosphohydrolase [Sphingomonadales bacterium]|jgi:putative (di)nucleoside polyphosphate hydrolase|nr:RNA pyrophosphohydrolase [Sphingomonadales bacterium]MBK9003807.1 RNA pyrophosphohydrolase [Sphingomonadales bacterium]MBK9268981.1 RNA pyrophosphohydrolase [Sphingomonadales bacterium]MBP6435405.1 RNA pyrophosphohydrolase [Sphingorhabdus sp.]